MHPGTDTATCACDEPGEDHDLHRDQEFATSWLLHRHVCCIYSGPLHHSGRLHHLNPRLANEDDVVEEREDDVVEERGEMNWKLPVTRPSPV